VAGGKRVGGRAICAWPEGDIRGGFGPRGKEPRSLVWRHREGVRREGFAGDGRTGDDAEEVHVRGVPYAEEGAAIRGNGS
jgi:hypothetical protein